MYEGFDGLLHVFTFSKKPKKNFLQCKDYIFLWLLKPLKPLKWVFDTNPLFSTIFFFLYCVSCRNLVQWKLLRSNSYSVTKSYIWWKEMWLLLTNLKLNRYWKQVSQTGNEPSLISSPSIDLNVAWSGTSVSTPRWCPSTGPLRGGGRGWWWSPPGSSPSYSPLPRPSYSGQSPDSIT